jgi:inorganic pyrophosphatase
MEIDTMTAGNPLVQDVTKASLPRFYALDSLSNYGAIPQTYEDPQHADAWTGLKGDGDPIDVCEVGSALATVGGVYTVRVLGALAMVDDGETDWKVLAVRTDDALVAGGGVRDIRGAPDALLRTADEVREWFRVYKVPEGKGENTFALGGAWQDRDTTLAIIASTHAQWRAALAAPPQAKGPWVPRAGWSAEGVAQPPSKPSAELSVAWAPR